MKNSIVLASLLFLLLTSACTTRQLAEVSPLEEDVSKLEKLSPEEKQSKENETAEKKAKKESQAATKQIEPESPLQKQAEKASQKKLGQPSDKTQAKQKERQTSQKSVEALEQEYSTEPSSMRSRDELEKSSDKASKNTYSPMKDSAAASAKEDQQDGVGKNALEQLEQAAGGEKAGTKYLKDKDDEDPSLEINGVLSDSDTEGNAYHIEGDDAPVTILGEGGEVIILQKDREQTSTFRKRRTWNMQRQF
ncbi:MULTISPECIES: hypothetical protein [unclassified Oleiphilus]|jgi:hypothetical protein|uniref:hypothetical protein n=4 Tax=Oleiphilus TaxID=141450 RepID=UPI0007C305C6|nr:MULTISPECIES: hypothetical protein [unclassified Oleiphilus]KZY29408.1 hypothetical protein A3729_12285 [Oleiphilus sp. HI0043]KZZ31951.1 hypothetical protein A3757_05280 [Oleiphilus sp. HI0117]KZZ32564.1 hypothetical protein A3756_05460 [Oleiphilus sp. HI0086]KZZ57444.1 hypothetical protein A3761_06725 [Oleiphilus sp. HI0123]KZZ65943.1 hypothetical protein A3763_03860 [Oleiphilus sp. HI0128]